MNIIVGGAQIGQVYGISNHKYKKKIDHFQFKKIFTYLKKNKIYYVDSALNYKNSLKILSKYKSELKIIAKINIGNKKFFIEDFLNDLKKCFNILNSKKIYCIMVHDTDNFNKLSKIEKKNVIELLNNLKKKRKITKIGFSVYHTKDLIRVINFADVVQFPLNIFDQRFDKIKLIKKLKMKNIKIHLRSIFLQGLIFLSYNKIIKLFKVDQKKIKIFFEKYKYKEDRIFHCLNFIKTRNFYSQMIIGFNDLNELKQIIKINKKKTIKTNYNKFKINNKKIILPYLWKKKSMI